MKTIEEILETVKENDGDYTPINIIDQELMKMRDALLQVIEDKIAKEVACNPNCIDVSIKIMPESIIQANDLNLRLFYQNEKLVFHMVLDELDKTKYQDVGSKRKPGIDEIEFIFKILLYDLTDEDKKEYKLIKTSKFVNVIIAVVSFLPVIVIPLLTLLCIFSSQKYGVPFEEDVKIFLFYSFAINACILTIMSILSHIIDHFKILFRDHVLETYQK